MPKHFFTPKDNGGQKEKIFFPTSEFDVNDENKDQENIFNEKIDNIINMTTNYKFTKFNILEKICSSISVNNNKKKIFDKKNKSNIIVEKQIEKVNKPKKKKQKVINKIELNGKKIMAKVII